MRLVEMSMRRPLTVIVLMVAVVLEDIQAQQELVRARTEYLSAITEYNKAQYELRKALGSL